MSASPSPDARRFVYAKTSLDALASNGKHSFAIGHAIRVFPSNALYTYIPKNACSTLRYSIARANGMIGADDDPHWIHRNTTSYLHDTASAFSASYAFVILRCPLSRIASLYLDKFVGMRPEAWLFYDKIDHSRELVNLTFRHFLRGLKDGQNLRLNEHWRPQVDFLLFENYDHYFRLEDFKAAESVLKARIGLHIHDTRAIFQHDSSGLEEISHPQAANLTTLECLNMRVRGQKPSIAALFDDECRSLCMKLYSQDFALYQHIFGKSPLMAALGI